MKLLLLASSALAVIVLVSPAVAGKTGSKSSTPHSVGDNTGNGSSNAATTPQGDGDDAAGSATTFNGSSSSWTGNIVVRSRVQIDATGHTFGEDIDSDSERRQTDAKVGDLAKAGAGKDKNHNPTASSSAVAFTLARTHKPNGKDALVQPPAHASASATGGKVPVATATAKTGKEHVTVTATAGAGVTGSGGKQVTLHPKAGETVTIEYTPHTEAVGISYQHRAEAYAAAAKGGHVYVGSTLIDAARAAAYAFAEGWNNNGAYAYAKAESSATATSTDGFDHSHAQAFVEAEAAIWQGGSVLHVKLPKLPNLGKLHLPPSTASNVTPDGVNLLLAKDPPPDRMFCMAKHLPTGQWALGCTKVSTMPPQAEIDARLRAGWTEIITTP